MDSIAAIGTTIEPDILTTNFSHEPFASLSEGRMGSLENTTSWRRITEPTARL
jgi:hypothetical protein